MIKTNWIMDTNEKMGRLLEMLEHPEKFSEKEINDILSDEECRECYDLLSEARRAMTAADSDTPVPDVDEAWKLFHVTRQRDGWRRVAVACIAVVLVSGLSFAAVNVVRHFTRAERGEQTAPATEMQDISSRASAEDEQTDTVATLPIMYQNEELQTIMNDISARYGVNVVYKKHKARTMRLYLQLSPDMSLDDVVRVMNHFENLSVTLSDDELIVR